MLNIFFILSIVFFSFAGLTGIYIIFDLTQEVEAQQVIETYNQADQTKSYTRVDFRIFVLASDLGDGNNFLDSMEIEKAKYVLKSIPLKARVNLFCNHITAGEIWEIYGGYVFKNGIDADKVKEFFKTNIPLDKVRYGWYIITENTHHWENPQPDQLIEFRDYGNKAQYERAFDTCRG